MLAAMTLFAGPAAGRAAGLRPSPGRWLLDHGRTLGLNTTYPTTDDAELVLVWMEAAARVDPDLAEAYLWQFDLLNRLSRADAARAALGSYCKLNSADVSARLDLIDRQFERGQSVEARRAFCAATLKTAGLPLMVQSDLHRRLADLYVRGGERDRAEVHANKAIEAFVGNVAAHSLLVELADEQTRPARQVRMLCAAVSALPVHAEEMWRLARVLDDLSLHAEAARWYERARVSFERPQGGGRAPVDFLVDFAACYADDGRYELALEVGEQVVGLDPDAVEVRYLLVDAARRAGRAEVVNRHQKALRKRFDGLDPASPGRGDLATACQAAWYYLRCEPDPVRAVGFASRARELAPESPEVQTVFGLAKLATGEADEADAALRPWAGTNQWAATGLGEALLAKDRTEEAIEVLRAGEAMRHSGPAYERIAAALASVGRERAPAPRRTAVLDAVREFDERVLSFVDRPTDALRLEILVSGGQWAYGDPWLCELRLTNTAAFPIAFGDQQMVAGQVLVSLRWGDTPKQQLTNYLALSLALKPVLAVGESVTVAQTLDVGPAAVLAGSMPQRELALSFSVLLDPVLDRRRNWVSALPGFSPAGVQVKRVAADASRTGIAALLGTLREDAEADRIRSARTLAGLIAERRAVRRTPPDYVLHRVDELKLRRLLLSVLDDSTPVVRAAVLDSLRTVELGPRMLEQVAPLLSDANWLVRLVALDMLSESQGASFRPVLESTSAADPDELVRRLAGLRVKQLPTPSAE